MRPTRPHCRLPHVITVRAIAAQAETADPATLDAYIRQADRIAAEAAHTLEWLRALRASRNDAS
ncbi:hypothetical protein [Streptomyces sp. NPDC088348]|uniref:hypothetical protein n=1 Tax=Streptomyces sp. NPDC088348 TaxID=3365853 RepID=UPI00382DCCFA